MANPVERAHALFRSKFSESGDAIKAKLEAAHVSLATLESQVSDLAYATAIEEEGAAERMAALTGEIARGKENVTLLQTALTVAEAKEQERVREAQAKADAARLRALSQHLGALRTKAAEYERLVAQQVELWADVIRASDKVRKLVGGGSAAVERRLNPTHLRILFQQEITRQAFTEHPSAVKWPVPGATKPVTWHPESIPNLTDTLASLSRGALQAEGGTGNE